MSHAQGKPASGKPRVAIVADRARPGAAAAAHAVREIAAVHASSVAELDLAGAIPGGFDLLVAVGGDGTIIGQTPHAVAAGAALVGVNSGRLGFLAEFDLEELRTQAGAVFGPKALVRERLLLEAAVRRESGTMESAGIAVNDCVVAAGSPFRMIELALAFDDAAGPAVSGDGLIVSTPIGSTAYNASAGGPIVHPDEDVLVVTPNAAHSLAFRPIVVGAATQVSVRVLRANAGTSLVLDGEPRAVLAAGDEVIVKRHARRARFIGNPRRTYWQTLAGKLRWAATPVYRA